ncbi:GFA family protein [Tabrizicola sp.]|uniref:GFA family protein n=1 Tax=Tabrizicola sp. TaxID=2005166 RepID=UPI00286A4493|nr:GFA family protein [Tabrizicola sp.]
MAGSIHATCACGAITSATTADPVVQIICHCSDCRDATGGDFVTGVFFKLADVTIKGSVTERAYTSARGNRTTRELCAACGTPMFDRSEGFAHLIGVFAERIALPFKAEPKLEMWTASRLPHVAPHPGLPGFPGPAS